MNDFEKSYSENSNQFLSIFSSASDALQGSIFGAHGKLKLAQTTPKGEIPDTTYDDLELEQKNKGNDGSNSHGRIGTTDPFKKESSESHAKKGFDATKVKAPSDWPKSPEAE